MKKDEIVKLLQLKGEEKKSLFLRAKDLKIKNLGNKVFYRGLIEMSNICAKDCYYCGIRKSNINFDRYNLDDKIILTKAEYAYKAGFGSIVLQGGELMSDKYTDKIAKLVKEIKRISNNNLGITLSLGEQTLETYKLWRKAGAHRYLLRIEASNERLYKKLHPDNDLHNFNKRIKALSDLKSADYQTGTGVMIGLPFQKLTDLAEDINFFKEIDIDMVGMGPYIEHVETPLYPYKDSLMKLEDRLQLTYKMIAILRLEMPFINIAASTALQSIDPVGREKAVQIGANIVMPNITPVYNKKNYKLYDNKPCIEESEDECADCLEKRLSMVGAEVGFNEFGDSKHYFNRKKQEC